MYGQQQPDATCLPRPRAHHEGNLCLTCTPFYPYPFIGPLHPAAHRRTGHDKHALLTAPAPYPNCASTELLGTTHLVVLVSLV
jgi:hypothetical protein